MKTYYGDISFVKRGINPGEYACVNTQSGVKYGFTMHNPPGNRYVFAPEKCALFSVDRLLAIADFISQLNLRESP